MITNNEMTRLGLEQFAIFHRYSYLVSSEIRAANYEVSVRGRTPINEWLDVGLGHLFPISLGMSLQPGWNGAVAVARNIEDLPVGANTHDYVRSKMWELEGAGMLGEQLGRSQLRDLGWELSELGILIPLYNKNLLLAYFADDWGQLSNAGWDIVGRF